MKGKKLALYRYTILIHINHIMVYVIINIEYLFENQLCALEKDKKSSGTQKSMLFWKTKMFLDSETNFLSLIFMLSQKHLWLII